MNDRSKQIRRAELYKEVWTTPIHQLAKKYGLSDVGLAKICKRYNIPRPPRGYWARKEAGQRVQRLSLPRGEDRMITIAERLDPLAPSPPSVLDEKCPPEEKQNE